MQREKGNCRIEIGKCSQVIDVIEFKREGSDYIS